MNRKDAIIVAALVAMLIFWPRIDRWIVRQFYPERLAPVERVEPPETAAEEDGTADRAEGANVPPPALGPAEQPVPPEEPSEPMRDVATADDEPERAPQFFVLRNAHAEYRFSSHAAALVSARLLDYRQTPDDDSDPVELDFAESPALAWKNVPGAAGDFEGEVSSDGRTLSFERRTSAGWRIRRRVELGESYLLRVREEWSRARAQEPPRRVEAPELTLGFMTNLPGETLMRGAAFLGVDTLSPGGEKVRHWGAKMPAWFKEEMASKGGSRPPLSVRRRVPDPGRPVDWAAVKNKYFVQILRPENGADGAWAEAKRVCFPTEETDPAFRPRIQVATTGAALLFPSGEMAPEGESLVWEMEYYVGPKKYDELQRLRYHQVDVMEFGMWGGIGKVLLRTLNLLYGAIPNYGVAIILLTILIRVMFWPITHKGTQSMKRMQEIQPLVNEIRAKYKDNPQRQQQEIMALYKEHKVNPLGGCLPMLIQIPVFIALFVVLRSAIELRFASFLWVRDLSEPENLLAGRLPFGLSLNLLPLIMTVTQVWQQKLSPQTGDPSQRKMMVFMPVIMLVFFYNFASGLVLYWTTNQCLMIAQQLLQRRTRTARRVHP